MADLDLTKTSNPVMIAARHFGISTEFAYLIADGMLASEGRGAWPKGHYWHGWAATESGRAHGIDATFDFAKAIYAHQQEQAKGMQHG